MATLETVMQMKQQGIPEPQIIQTLQQQGIAPNEINEALSQSNIKTELAPNPTEASIPGTQMPGTAMPQQIMPQQGMPEQMQPPMTPLAPQAQQMQPSMGAEQIPAAQPLMTQEIQPPMQMAQETYSAPSPTDQMPYYEEYQPQQSSDIETINDIAEQIVEEKTTALKKQILDTTRFKEELILEIQKINQRLTKIENTFNQLQMAILGKIGEYGEDIKNISKGIDATQDSFSKMINPIMDKARTKEKTRPSPKTKKDSNDFENYLR